MLPGAMSITLPPDGDVTMSPEAGTSTGVRIRVFAAGTSVQVSEKLGLWVLAIGLMRYAFVAASWAMPWLTAPLYPSVARKTVAAVQGVVLVVAVSEILPVAWTFAAVVVALTSLVWSFGRDVVWLARTRVPAARPAPIAVLTRRLAHGTALPGHNQAA